MHAVKTTAICQYRDFLHAFVQAIVVAIMPAPAGLSQVIHDD